MSTSDPLMPNGSNIYKYQYGHIGTEYRWYSDGSPPHYYDGFLHLSFGENFSHGHPRVNGHYQGSSDWLMYKFDVKWQSAIQHIFRVNYATPAYIGMVNSGGFSWAFPPISIDSLKLENFNHGAEAFAALRPDLPDFQAASNLYELKDPLGLLKKRISNVRNKTNRRLAKLRHSGRSVDGQAAELYLAYYFGWLPLYKDIQQFVRAFNGAKKRFDQLQRDEGKSVKRRRTLSGSYNLNKDDSVSSTEWHTAPWNPYVGPIMETQCYAPIGTARTIGTGGNSKHNWVVGRSRYLLPPGPRDDAWKSNISRRILGGVLSPNQVWNMIPWSWAADYFSGLHHFLDAVQTGIADQYIIDAGDCMTSTEYWDKREYIQYPYTSQYAGSEQSSSCCIRRTTKARTRASPFGWGLETPSDHQMSMLGALGYSSLAEASEKTRFRR